MIENRRNPSHLRRGHTTVVGGGTIYTRNRQTPDLIAHIVTEKHRAKLVRDGSDTH